MPGLVPGIHALQNSGSVSFSSEMREAIVLDEDVEDGV